MRRLAALGFAAALAVPCFATLASADGTPAGGSAAVAGEIAWKANLKEAFEAGKKDGKPVFIAINAARVDGGTPEPAGKELREHVYLDPTIVAKSAEFSCALLKSDGNSADFAEIRSRFGIEGQVVSPQHIFAFSDGGLIDKREYWSFPAGQASVDALLAMMDKALAAHRLHAGMPAAPPPAPAPGTTPPPTPGEAAKPAEPGAPPAQTADEARAAWISNLVQKVRLGSAGRDARDAAIAELMKGDQKNDCVDPLCTVLLEMKKDPETQIVILKALGKPGLEFVVPTVIQLLDDKTDDVRSNAAVTLEYVGSARAVDPLMKRLPRERDEVVFNNACRALGRCGVKQEAVRKALIHEIGAVKSAKTIPGPTIGLAYFEKDAEAARALEKFLKKEGDPPKRAFMLWALTEIQDPKSGDFVKKEIQPQEKNRWIIPFVNGIVALLTGDTEGTGRGAVDIGMSYTIGSLGTIGGSARKDRDQSQFKPKGEFAPRPPGGPGGGGPGGGGPGGGGPGGMGG